MGKGESAYRAWLVDDGLTQKGGGGRSELLSSLVCFLKIVVTGLPITEDQLTHLEHLSKILCCVH